MSANSEPEKPATRVECVFLDTARLKGLVNEITKIEPGWTASLFYLSRSGHWRCVALDDCREAGHVPPTLWNALLRVSCGERRVDVELDGPCHVAISGANEDWRLATLVRSADYLQECQPNYGKWAPKIAAGIKVVIVVTAIFLVRELVVQNYREAATGAFMLAFLSVLGWYTSRTTRSRIVTRPHDYNKTLEFLRLVLLAISSLVALAGWLSTTL